MHILPNAASILVSEDCNLNCSYCFEKTKNKQKMSVETAIDTYEFLLNNEIKNRENGLSHDNILLTMFGGEPMLNFETIRATLEYVKQKKSDIKTDVMIITNGTILTDDMAIYLKDYCTNFGTLSIQISVDGLKDSHDYYRVYKDGSGSYDIIEKNIPKFKKIFSDESFESGNNRSQLHTHGSLNKMTIRTMYDSWKHIKYVWGIPHQWMMPIHAEEWDKEDVAIYNQQLTKIANEILNLSINNKTSQFIADFAPLNRGVRYCLNTVDKVCGAGCNYITITANGDIYPCHHFYFMKNSKEMKIGDIFNGIDDNKRMMYLKYDGTDINCFKKGCENHNCYRCLAENYDATGSIINCKFDYRCEMSSIEHRLIANINKILKSEGIVK